MANHLHASVKSFESTTAVASVLFNVMIALPYFKAHHINEILFITSLSVCSQGDRKQSLLLCLSYLLLIPGLPTKIGLIAVCCICISGY